MHRVSDYQRHPDGIEAMSLISDRAFPRHAHDEYGVGVIVGGAHRSWSGRGAVDAFAGDAIMVNPGEMHDGAPLDGASPRAWRMLYLAPALVERIAAQALPGTLELTRPAVRDVRLAAAVERLFARLAVPDRATLGRDEALVSLIAALLTRHAARASSSSSGSMHTANAPATQIARERIDAAPAEPVSLDELAALAGASRFQVLRGFSRDVGITPHAYLVQARTRLARALIERGVAIADAAAEAGFADQSHLTRAFTRHFGISPAQFVKARRFE